MKHSTILRSSTSKTRRWYSRAYYWLLEPRQQQAELRSRETVLLILLLGTLCVTLLLFLLLVISYLALGNIFVLPRIGFSVGAFIYTLIIYILARKGRYYISAIGLIGTYAFFAVIGMWYWGVNLPSSILIMSLTITLAGILLQAKYALYAAFVASSILITLQVLVRQQLHIPDESWLLQPATFGDVLGYCVVFIILALISWLFGRQMEHSLLQAHKAETALLREKELLAVRLKERTAKLRTAQLKEMQQLYRFAELGQVSTALLHELANHLTALTLDIEDLDQQQHSQAIKRARRTIFALDAMIDQVRLQLRDDNRVQAFSVSTILDEVVEFTHKKAQKENVKVELVISKSKQPLVCEGDPLRLYQVFVILISNAIDAYQGFTSAKDRIVEVSTFLRPEQIVIKVQDWGCGIPASRRKKLFMSPHSTKKSGMGIGLLIARQMIETHFRGTLKLSSSKAYTEFVITLPRKSTYEAADN